MICPKCGGKNDAGRFCQFCGSRLIRSQTSLLLLSIVANWLPTLIFLALLGGGIWFAQKEYQNYLNKSTREEAALREREQRAIDERAERERQRSLEYKENQQKKMQIWEEEQRERRKRATLVEERSERQKALLIEERRKQEEKQEEMQKQVAAEEARRQIELRQAEEVERKRQEQEKAAAIAAYRESIQKSPVFQNKLKAAALGDAEKQYEVSEIFSQELNDSIKASYWRHMANKTSRSKLFEAERQLAEYKGAIQRYETELPLRQKEFDSASQMFEYWKQQYTGTGGETLNNDRLMLRYKPDVRDLIVKYQQDMHRTKTSLGNALKNLGKARTDVSEAQNNVAKFQRIILLTKDQE